MIDPLYIFEQSDSLLRLLNLTGQARLDERLTPQQAAAVFVNHGAEAGKLANPDYVKSFRMDVNRANHPDKGGDGRAAAEVNAAYDVIKGGFRGTPHAGEAHDRGFKSGDWWSNEPKPEPKPKTNGQSYADADGAPVMKLYVCDRQGGTLEFWADATGSATDIEAKIAPGIMNGDIAMSDVVVAVDTSWPRTINIVWLDRMRVLEPVRIERQGDMDLTQDPTFPALLQKTLQKQSRHAAWEREERDARANRSR